MPFPNSKGWMLSYEDPRSDTRMLVSLPKPMLRDLQLLAKAREISMAELVRVSVTREIAHAVQARPEIAPSFRGKLLAEKDPEA